MHEESMYRHGAVRYYLAGPIQTESREGLIVLIHGLGTSLDFWYIVAPQLAQRELTLALDLPGAGDSETPPGPYTLKNVAAETALFLDNLAVRNATLVGHSLGALLALQIAGTRPELVARLILVDPTLFSVEAVLTRPIEALKHPRLFLTTLTQFAAVSLPTKVSRALVGSRLFRKVALSGFTHSPADIEPGVLRQAMSRVGGKRAIRVLQALPAARGVRLADLMKQVVSPIALIWGSDDPLVTESDREKTRGLARVYFEQELPGCGHLPMIEVPELLTATILAAHMADDCGEE